LHEFTWSLLALIEFPRAIVALRLSKKEIKLKKIFSPAYKPTVLNLIKNVFKKNFEICLSKVLK
tara:strand:- start:705 stop:896 length:192 start_codon:yes stop_codon:yes gene_type:complete